MSAPLSAENESAALDLSPPLSSGPSKFNVYSQALCDPLNATTYIGRMRGGAQSKLLIAGDGSLWVVKFQNNPQHLRLRANCWIATHIARTVGLSVPQQAGIAVSSSLIDSNPDLVFDMGSGLQTACMSGLQFGSRYVGGLLPMLVTERLTDDQLLRINNLGEFAGILALDKWLGNTDARQAVFTRGYRESRYRAYFIDQGHCFAGGQWLFFDNPMQGLYPNPVVYAAVTGWESFEPYLTRIEQFSDDDLWSIANSTPPDWCGPGLPRLDELVDNLIQRKSQVRGLIDRFRKSSKDPFPRWRHKRH